MGLLPTLNCGSVKYLDPGFPLFFRVLPYKAFSRTNYSHWAHHTCRLVYAEGMHPQPENPKTPSHTLLWAHFLAKAQGVQVCCLLHLRSVLSAREMAGFLTALLHAALLLQERYKSQHFCQQGGDKWCPSKYELPRGGTKCYGVCLDCIRGYRTLVRNLGPGPDHQGLNPDSNTYYAHLGKVFNISVPQFPHL